jgi:hypothetical protein
MQMNRFLKIILLDYIISRSNVDQFISCDLTLGLFLLELTWHSLSLLEFIKVK